MSQPIPEQPTLDTEARFSARVRRFVLHDLWHIDLGPRSLTASALRLLQMGVMIGRGFVQDELLLRASALTYVTALAMMPLLVVTVALIGVVGGQQTVVDFVVDQLTAVSPDARDLIYTRLHEVRIGSLGSVGGTMLVLTSILTLRHLERTLNGIWGIQKGRSWTRRFADYLAVLMVAPVLTAAAVSLATTLQSEAAFHSLLRSETFSTMYQLSLSLIPQLLLMVAFTFLYWFFPNTRVHPFSALIGGFVAMLLFSVARFLYVDLSIGAARYSVLFGGMVALPLILAWLYVCWAVILLGAEVSFAHQNLGHYRRELRRIPPGFAERESVALYVALAVARAFVTGRSAPEAGRLSDQIDVPVRSVRNTLDALEESGLVVKCARGDEEEGYLPGRPVADISVDDVLRAVRGPRLVAHEGADQFRAGAEWGALESVIESVIGDLDRAVAGGVGELRLGELVHEVESKQEGRRTSDQAGAEA
ncbi:MAG: YhjD/YihY/BrkB family envelope integrity protein [Myxococcota bacterium]|nr:YhjD/YihY/BrkB family envelope integrity protein [Myxococcota bacterium]